ncbi:unnamed protein product [Rotaria socialis]|uniref:Uncharacterized protein n=1 Tax=Rotaria socialis TaxID=392032 RepID=A0A817UMG9_9BILA|nr:unnamed protein product [Rotaria socialis]CAF4378140.1 unnamed protein product [Rotaria socialis]
MDFDVLNLTTMHLLLHYLQQLQHLVDDQHVRSCSKQPFILVRILFTMSIIPTIVLAILYANEKNAKSTHARNDICLSPYCIKAANYLIDSIDQSVEPCEDFYQFSCGSWLKNTKIPNDADEQNSFQILDKQLQENIVNLLSTASTNSTAEPQSVTNARTLYRSCIDEMKIETDGVDAILSLINTHFDGWPILQGSSWNSSAFNLTNLLLKLRQYSYNIIYLIGSLTDENNSSATSIYVGQASLGLLQRQYYENETNITIAYRQFVSNLARALTNDTSMIDQDVKEIFDFDKNISKYHWTVAEQRARNNETVRTTVGNMSRILNTTFDFKNYLYRAYQFGNVTLNDMDTVALHEIDFLKQVSTLIDKTSPRILQNYILWYFMMDQAALMPKNIRTIKEKFERTIRGTSAEQPRTAQCSSFVNTAMGFAVSKLYIKKYFDENARNQSLEMIENIRNSFIDILDKSTWMDNTSKVKAIEKVKGIEQHIGYPDYLGSENNTKLENDYAAYVFDTSYIHNNWKIQVIQSIENFQLLRKPVLRKQWETVPPTIINAFYDSSKNQIVFPAGILQMPFFDKNAPKYLNYGGIGMVIGHEITHGFDDNGRQFDKDGNRIPWWTGETIEKFNNRKQCIIDQYKNFSVPQVDMKSNGDQTQGEDIADNGGLKASFYAYQNWAKNNANIDKKLPGLTNYSAEQLFFINFAHVWCVKMTDSAAFNQILTGVHSLGEFRVTGPTSNFDEFDRAFGCKSGQGNSRVEKCVVW